MERRNVTITMDEQTARWARLEAARRDTSVSRLVGELIGEHMRADTEYSDAMAAFLERGPAHLQNAAARYPQRDEVHDRAGLR